VKVLRYNLILFFFIPFQGFSQYALISSNTFSNLLVEVALSNKQKKDGLMFVEQLETNGLLLYYKAPKIVNIWMKNTLIPLDIIFIDENMEIISIKKGNPFSKDIISSEFPVIGVLEIPQGCTKKLKIKKGHITKLTFLKGKKKNIRYYHCLDDY
jgi:hypothetical protein